MITDQRRDHRVSFFLGGDVYDSPDGSRAGRAVVRDVSVSGLRIEVLAPVEEGRTLYLDFTVAGKFHFQKIPVQVKRLYRHSGSYLLGLAFREAHDRRRAREALAYVIEKG